MAGLVSPAEDAVAAELRRWAREPFAYCALSVLAYVERVKRQRLLPRPTIGGKFAVARLTRSTERFIAIAANAMERLACPPVEAPIRGDVGLIELPGTGLTAAIFLGRLWAARGDRMVIVTEAVQLRAWRVACRKR